MANKPTNKTVTAEAKKRYKSAKQLEENKTFTEERKNFIDKFTLCDVTCKTYVENYKKVKKNKDDGSEISFNLDMRTIPAALQCFGLDIPKHKLTPIFGAGKQRGQKTCKKLRDGIVHAMNEGDIIEMHERYNELMNYMNIFLRYFD